MTEETLVKVRFIQVDDFYLWNCHICGTTNRFQWTPAFHLPHGIAARGPYPDQLFCEHCLMVMNRARLRISSFDDPRLYTEPQNDRLRLLYNGE